MPLPSDAMSLDAIAADVGARTLGLLAGTSALSRHAVVAPSVLPGWTRGHVLAHLADNAEAFAAALGRAAGSDDAGLMYPSAQARDASIEAGAGRPPEEHLERLTSSAHRLAKAWRDLPAHRLDAVLAGTSGWVRPVRDVPWMRWRELALHGVDLGWPAEFAPGDELVARLLDESATGLAARAGAPALHLTDTDTGKTWTIGPDAADRTGDGVAVSGPARDLALWLTGRADGAALTASGSLPALPPWL